jgi:hypothetical protein
VNGRNASRRNTPATTRVAEGLTRVGYVPRSRGRIADDSKTARDRSGSVELVARSGDVTRKGAAEPAVAPDERDV